MSTRIFGSGIRRREDPRLITGAGTYTDDLALPGMAHAAMLRSPHAHARIARIDTSRASRSPGVLAIFTGADVAALKPVPCAWLIPNANLKVATYQAICTDVVRYVGDIVAVVVADTVNQAYDALTLIDVDYEPLPSVTDPEKAMKSGAPQLHKEVPGNEAFHWVVAGGDVEAAFKSAEVIVKERIVHQRLIPNAMEPRAALAQW
jgi:carbon-monoxide dehydrogenase large subunit